MWTEKLTSNVLDIWRPYVMFLCFCEKTVWNRFIQENPTPFLCDWNTSSCGEDSFRKVISGFKAGAWVKSLGANEPSVEAGFSNRLHLGQAAVFDQCSSGRPCGWLLVHQWCRDSMELIPWIAPKCRTWVSKYPRSYEYWLSRWFSKCFFSPPIRIQCEHSFQLSDSQVETLQSHRRHDGFLHLMYKAGICMCFWEIWAWNIKPGLTTTGTRMFLVSFVCVLATHQAFWSQTLPLLLIASLVACLDKQLGFSSNDSWTLRGQHWKHRI